MKFKYVAALVAIIPLITFAAVSAQPTAPVNAFDGARYTNGQWHFSIIIPADWIFSLSGTRAQSELVKSWADNLRSAHSRRNFEKTALRFLEALPAGIRQATVEDVREALAKLTEGASDATACQYVLRVK
jgi:hypothetical protein